MDRAGQAWSMCYGTFVVLRSVSVDTRVRAVVEHLCLALNGSPIDDTSAGDLVTLFEYARTWEGTHQRLEWCEAP